MAGPRTVVVIPGANFGPFIPQLLLPMFAAVRRGAEHVAVEWQNVAEIEGLTGAERQRWVHEQVAQRLTGSEPASSLIVAKSLGSFAAAQAADLCLPAIWVTPLLTLPEVVEPLRRCAAPFLLAGGTADPWWDGELARALTPHVLELDGADHGLFLPGPLRASVDNLGRMAEACETFLDDVVWPAS